MNFSNRYVNNMTELDEKLTDACREGELENVIAYIEQGADINCEDIPLLDAILNKRTDIVKYLINYGADYGMMLDYILNPINSIEMEEVIYAFTFYSTTMINVFPSRNSLLIKYINYHDIDNCKKLIDILRTKGIDVYDLIENEA